MPKKKEYDIDKLNHFLGTNYAKNVEGLAEMFGSTRSSLYGWLARNGYEIKTIKKIVKKKGK